MEIYTIGGLMSVRWDEAVFGEYSIQHFKSILID